MLHLKLKGKVCIFCWRMAFIDFKKNSYSS